MRQLESLIRLSEARARLDLDAVVSVKHVEEALSLLMNSMCHLDHGDVVLEEEPVVEKEEGEMADEGETNNMVQGEHRKVKLE